MTESADDDEPAPPLLGEGDDRVRYRLAATVPRVTFAGHRMVLQIFKSPGRSGGRAATSCVNGTDRQSNGAQHPGRSPCAGLRSKFELAPRIHPIRPDPLCAGSVTAASNAHYARAPRPWILMCHDRSEGERMEITHEFLSMMLAVRRLGVTVTLHTLKARARSGVREAW